MQVLERLKRRSRRGVRTTSSTINVSLALNSNRLNGLIDVYGSYPREKNQTFVPPKSGSVALPSSHCPSTYPIFGSCPNAPYTQDPHPMSGIFRTLLSNSLVKFSQSSNLPTTLDQIRGRLVIWACGIRFVNDMLGNRKPAVPLEQQSRALTAMMHGQTIHAPLDRPSRICDVGCGTGSFSVTLGHNNPTADVLGIDLSKVPTLHAPLPNVSYIQGDIRKLAGKDPKLQSNSMDLAFSRVSKL